MMTNSDILRKINARIGMFKGMPKEYIQLANNPLSQGKPFKPPHREIWAKVTIKNANKIISSIDSSPRTRTPGIIFIQLFAPLNSGTCDLSLLADKWVEHMQFYCIDDLELLEASVLDMGFSSVVGKPSDLNFYQYNVNIPYRVN